MVNDWSEYDLNSQVGLACRYIGQYVPDAITRVPDLTTDSYSGEPQRHDGIDGFAVADCKTTEPHEQAEDVEVIRDNIGRVLLDKRRQESVRLSEAKRLASLGRIAAGVGHAIKNPLTFLMLNLEQSLKELGAAAHDLGDSSRISDPETKLQEIGRSVASVVEMLRDCQVGGERISEVVVSLRQLFLQEQSSPSLLDVGGIIDQAISLAGDQIRDRARLIKSIGKTPSFFGNGLALVKVFATILINAAYAIPAGNAEKNEIRVSARFEAGGARDELVVEISDTGIGIAPGVMTHIFDPFFTTKPEGHGTGLGLSISRQTVTDHGGHITVESQPDKGAVFRVFLPASF